MSQSIPIANRHAKSHQATSSDAPLAASLPARAHRSFHNPSSRQRPPSILATQDDLATISWPPRPSVELVSRSARKFHAHSTQRALLIDDAKKNKSRFEPWDFSEVVNATDQVLTAFETGSVRAERPPREGVSGTYFIRGNESNNNVLCVFKPVDEEAADIDMSPTVIPIGHTFGPRSISGEGEFSLGPAHGISSPLAQSPPSTGPLFDRAGSLSSESDFDSRFYRASGFHVGEGAYKEVAAYLLDHDRFSRVPQTVLAKCNFTSEVDEKAYEEPGSPEPSFISESGEGMSDSEEEELEGEGSQAEKKSHLRTKMGAFQVYCSNVGDGDDFGPGVFQMEQVHRIAILDIRTLNHDRHGGNILVTKCETQHHRFDLVPIDHGFILPEVVRSIPWPVWMDWPMIRQPLGEREKRYVELLDPDAEAHILEEELDGKLRAGSLQGLKIATRLLQKGVAAGLTLYEIGLLMYTKRDEPAIKSELEKIILEAEEATNARERAFASESAKFTPGMPKDHHHHRRHQSMSSFSIHEAQIDDYFVRYATRRIHDVVSSISARKEKQRSPGAPRLSRARSIPDFGIGIKPLNALHKRPGQDTVPLNSPVTSPVSDAARLISATDMLEGQIARISEPTQRMAPIRIPINDGSIRRIAIPEPRTKTHASVGPISGQAVAMVMNGNPSASQGDSCAMSKGLPPLFKSTGRQSSPVAPLDVLSWDTRSS